MKPKKFNKKLSFNKDTVARLNDDELHKVQGRGYTDDPQIDTCAYNTCDPSFCITCDTCNWPCIIP